MVREIVSQVNRYPPEARVLFFSGLIKISGKFHRHHCTLHCRYPQRRRLFDSSWCLQSRRYRYGDGVDPDRTCLRRRKESRITVLSDIDGFAFRHISSQLHSLLLDKRKVSQRTDMQRLPQKRNKRLRPAIVQPHGRHPSWNMKNKMQWKLFQEIQTWKKRHASKVM